MQTFYVVFHKPLSSAYTIILLEQSTKINFFQIGLVWFICLSAQSHV